MGQSIGLRFRNLKHCCMGSDPYSLRVCLIILDGTNRSKQHKKAQVSYTLCAGIDGIMIYIYVYIYICIYIYEPGPRTLTPPMVSPPTPTPPPPPQNLVFACYLHIYIHIYNIYSPFHPSNLASLRYLQHLRATTSSTDLVYLYISIITFFSNRL